MRAHPPIIEHAQSKAEQKLHPTFTYSTGFVPDQFHIHGSPGPSGLGSTLPFSRLKKLIDSYVFPSEQLARFFSLPLCSHSSATHSTYDLTLANRSLYRWVTGA